MTDSTLIIQGHPVNLWLTEMYRRVEKGESLVAVQEDHHARGFRSIRLNKVEGGFVLRSSHPALWEGEWPSMPPVGGHEALEIGITWVRADELHRELLVPKSLALEIMTGQAAG